MMSTSASTSSSASRTPAADDVLHPKSLACGDCYCDEWQPDSSDSKILYVKWSLCALHEVNIFAEPINPRWTTALSPNSSPLPRVLSPSPVNGNARILPNATRTVAAPGGTSITVPVNQTPSRPTSSLPNPRTIPSTSASSAGQLPNPPSLPPVPAVSHANPSAVSAGGSRSDVVSNAVQVYSCVLARVKDPANPVSVNKACGFLGVTPRNFYRKNKIAEMYHLDPSRLDSMIQTLTTATGRARFSIEALNKSCADALARGTLAEKRARKIRKGEFL